MKKLLVIFFFFVACTGNYHPKDVGALSILEYPDNKELNKWIEIDSQYAKVYQVRRYFENFVKKDFFEEEENKVAGVRACKQHNRTLHYATCQPSQGCWWEGILTGSVVCRTVVC